jgi:ATPase subunit of ABC transporter with duplicated ATPase domains
MEDLLDSWPGTLIVVSHDRYLLERVTDHQYALLGDGSLRHLTGGVDQYLKLRAASLSAGSSQPITSAASTAAAQTETEQLGDQSAPAAKAKMTGAELRAAEKNLARIERALEKLAQDEERLHERMATHDQSDYAGLAALVEEQNVFSAKRDGLESEWLETSEQLLAD